MDTTRPSLIVRIKDANDSLAWNEFYSLYAPLLYRYARERGLRHEDAEEIRDGCLESIVRRIREFQYDRERGRFRSWLRTLVVNRVIDSLRKRREVFADSRELNQLEGCIGTPEEHWDEQRKLQYLKYCVERVQERVQTQTFSAFFLLSEEECTVTEVCKRLSMTATQVYKAKSRVLELIREEMHLLDAEFDV